ncbi:D-inositol-3-phosphate glycosyltransferase [Pseudoalteromonas holothuriae]|uniref:D-inositol-3-phosphate glycosyltransferase n=1 Tax=Pseudoalteromonas holothuriae TaxID=2963714 RepID=A0ABM9GEI3_9GAMM|nr:glycosyltransferase [Pseudoalteromonas sp. CIP111951]CAH9052763.1 D-inositol-3-phosphate glycosyltransferase [Pseudoalteromonas sp. CIP111951]
MHILILPSWYQSTHSPTLGSFFKEQGEALKQNGIQVGIIYPEPISLREIRLKPCIYSDTNNDTLNTLRLRYVTYPFLYKKNLQRRIKYYMKLYEAYIKKFGTPDIIHAHSFMYGPGGAAGIAAHKISKTHQVPFVVTEHASAIKTAQLKSFEITEIREACLAASLLICVSKTLSDTMHERFNLPKSPKVYGNVIDTKLFIPAEKKAQPFTFITVAQLRPIKRIDKIIKAFSQAQHIAPHISLIVAGDGEARSQLQSLVKSLGVKNVTFVGDCDRETIAQLMQMAHCYVNWSEFETFSVAIHEALSCGIQVICSPCKGPESTLLALKETLCDNHSIKSLVTGMRKVLENHPNTETTPSQKHAFIERHFSKDAIATNLIKEYKHIVKP